MPSRNQPKPSVGMKRFREDYAAIAKNPNLSIDDILNGYRESFIRHAPKMTAQERQAEADRIGSILYEIEKAGAKRGIVRAGSNPGKPN